MFKKSPSNEIVTKVISNVQCLNGSRESLITNKEEVEKRTGSPE